MVNSTKLLHGWQSSPNQRGTIDIIWSCVTALFVSIWVLMHLNIPTRQEPLWKIHLRKIKWLLLALLAPEVVMLFASGQWASAKRSVDDMKQSGYESWTIVHAFYADSGGFMLHSPDYPEFPVTAKQIHWLISHQYLAYPMITREEIWDKSKADFFAKAVAYLQVSWFVIQTAARGVQHLPITLLELATLAVLACSAATIFFWSFKPLDVNTPTAVELNTSMAKLLASAGEPANTRWHDTPLDFIEPLGYTSSQLPFNQLWGISKRPLPRLPNDRDSRLHNSRTLIMVAIPTAAFATFHLIGWNFDFPTKVEQNLWRWSCVGGGTVLGIGCTVEAASIIQSGYTTSGLTNLGGYKLRWPTNLLFLIPGLFYVAGRVVVIVEVIISLRALPEGSLSSPQWSSFLPHV